MSARQAMRRIVFLGVTAAIAFAAPVPLESQDQPAAFVHGLKSSGATWQAASDRLRREYRIRPYLPNLSWDRPWSDQALQLSSAVPGDTLISVGHSNGGLISRQWNRTSGRNNRIVTVGSLHQGAPLAANVLNGNVFYYGGSLLYGIFDAYDYYAYWEAQEIVNRLGQSAVIALQKLFNWAKWLPGILADHGYAAGAVAGSGIPVLYDMAPGSAVLQALNSPDNLSREAQSMYARVGISSAMATPINMQFFALLPGYAGSLSRARRYAWATAAAAYDYYQYYIDWSDPYYMQLNGGAWRWALAAMRLQDMDAAWCYLIGTLRYYEVYGLRAYSIDCAPSDGIVPVASMEYPGNTRQLAILDGPTHQRESGDSRVQDRLSEVFEQDFFVPRRVPGEPARLVLTPATASVAKNSTITLAANVYDIDNRLLTSSSVTWRSTNVAVATVSGSSSGGTVTGVSPGSGLIIADAQGYADTTSVTVTNSLSGVSIIGPAAIRPGTLCLWSASVQGAGYTFQWTVDGIPEGTDSDQFTRSASASFELGLTVTDATGATGSATRSVTVSGSAQLCPI